MSPNNVKKIVYGVLSLLLLGFLVLVLYRCSSQSKASSSSFTTPGVKTESIKVDSVYTAGSHQEKKSTFAPGDTINYDVDLNNNTSSQLSIAIRFQVFASDYNHSIDSHLYKYEDTIYVNPPPQKVSNYYRYHVIPNDIAPATYVIQVTVTPSDTLFSPVTDQSSFTIDPPSQLGPFDTGTFTRDNNKIEGFAHLTLFQNGSYMFSGCFQNDDEWGDQKYAFSWGFASASGVVYEFNHAGKLSGTAFFASSHKDCWNESGTNAAIAADWVPLVFQVNHWDGNVNTDLGPIVDTVINFIKTIVSVLQTVPVEEG